MSRIVSSATAAFLFVQTAHALGADQWQFIQTSQVVEKANGWTRNVSNGLLIDPDRTAVSTCIGRADFDDDKMLEQFASCHRKKLSSAAGPDDELVSMPAFKTDTIVGTANPADAFWQLNPNTGFLQFCTFTEDVTNFQFTCTAAEQK